jgi:hypothetical protein
MKAVPQGLKPDVVLVTYGTASAVPFLNHRVSTQNLNQLRTPGLKSPKSYKASVSAGSKARFPGLKRLRKISCRSEIAALSG